MKTYEVETVDRPANFSNAATTSSDIRRAPVCSQRASLLGERGGIGVEIDEHQRAELLDPDCGEAQVVWIEILDLIRPAGPGQAAIAPLRPGVIRAIDDPLRTLATTQFEITNTSPF